MTPKASTDTQKGAEGPIQASEDAAALVHRLCDDLGLWHTRTEAALFLAALAAAHDAEPIQQADLGALTTIGHTDEVDGMRDGLSVLSLLHEPHQDPQAVREERLPGWIEAGANRVRARMARTDVPEAVAEIVSLVDELDEES